jgi:hypothetical protein
MVGTMRLWLPTGCLRLAASPLNRLFLKNIYANFCPLLSCAPSASAPDNRARRDRCTPRSVCPRSASAPARRDDRRPSIPLLSSATVRDSLMRVLPAISARRRAAGWRERLVIRPRGRVGSGIFWVLRSGSPWYDVPENFGSYDLIINRFVRCVRW